MSLPEVTYEDGKTIDWRKEPADNVVDDDEELTETPADVIETLGFDPKELDKE